MITSVNKKNRNTLLRLVRIKLKSLDRSIKNRPDKYVLGGVGVFLFVISFVDILSYDGGNTADFFQYWEWALGWMTIAVAACLTMKTGQADQGYYFPWLFVLGFMVMGAHMYNAKLAHAAKVTALSISIAIQVIWLLYIYFNSDYKSTGGWRDYIIVVRPVLYLAFIASLICLLVIALTV